MIQPTALLPLAATNMTGTSTLTSTPLDLRQWTKACLFAIWTGTPTGTFTLEGSADYQFNATPTWVDISAVLGISLSQPAGAAGNNLIDISATGLPWVRLKYVNASGTGSLQIIGSAKGF